MTDHTATDLPRPRQDFENRLAFVMRVPDRPRRATQHAVRSLRLVRRSETPCVVRSANRVLYATWSEERRFQGDFETISS
jgi:hypothetical protein